MAKGGHDVPPEKVIARRSRSFDEFPWFFWSADKAWVFDNSGAEPKLVAEKELEGVAAYSEELLAELREGILRPRF